MIRSDSLRPAALIFAASVFVALFSAAVVGAQGVSAERDLVFDAAAFTLKSATVNGTPVDYRAYEGIVYVKRPVDAAYQRMNIYIPAAYFEGKTIGGYTAKTAPIFFPNSVGGYMPSRPGTPGQGFQGGGANAILMALSKGYVVAAPGTRGRTNQDASGKYTGKAPAVIVDLKAAVRYLRFNDERIPGDAERIISNGTSAGGAVSALLGASGNNPAFEPMLDALGAAKARDDVYATSAYCPITNLDHADMAYEWLFGGVNEYAGRGGNRPPAGPGPGDVGRGGMPGPLPNPPGGGAPLGPPPTGVTGGQAGPPPLPPAGAATAGPPASVPGTASQAGQKMTPEQVALSASLKALFPAYLNGLGLKGPDGSSLTLDVNGNGPFRDYVKSLLIASAQKALTAGKDLSPLAWLTISSGRVTNLDFDRYVRFVTRMKVTPAFDSQDLTSPENDLFGTEAVKARHFTTFGQEHSTVPATLADASQVGQMNAMTFIAVTGTTSSKFWRIRHGSADRDTSLAVPVMLATKLANAGKSVDLALPWGQGHGGDYDLDELFEWMARVCK